ncbi:MAG: hypothetical protein HPY45_06895 [Anaerolineae bacterium]|nr:hypothetical protein [Anaerolineae bacterium]
MERYQVMLEPQQRQRLERIARRERRSLSSVLRQALDVGLDALEGKRDVWERRAQILAKARRRLESLPLIEEDLVDAARNERDEEIERIWRGGL